MLRMVVISLTMLALLSIGCKGKTHKQCYEKTAVSACGELCDKGDSKACVKLHELGTEKCIKNNDKETCRWMCSYAKKGKLVYCTHAKKLGLTVE